METQLDLRNLKFNQLKAIAQANGIEVAGTAKQPFIDALVEFAEENELIIPDGILDEGPAAKKPITGTLPSGTYFFRQMRQIDDDNWKLVKMVSLTDAQAATLNAQTSHSNLRFDKINE